MSEIAGKKIGQLIISSDVVPTASEVEQYVGTVSSIIEDSV